MFLKLHCTNVPFRSETTLHDIRHSREGAKCEAQEPQGECLALKCLPVVVTSVISQAAHNYTPT